MQMLSRDNHNHEKDVTFFPMQVKLEDVFPMVAGQHMGSPFSHSAHIYQSRLNYILGYHTTYVGTPQALQLRDETMAILRMAVEH